MDECIFCKIVRGEIPSKKVYEDEFAYAFHDINPVAPVHLLLIPKLHIDSLATADESQATLLGKLLLLAAKLAKDHGLGSGFRTAIHTGRDGGQIVFHLHLHIIGGSKISTL